ncbi:MAG: hypothetical protein MJZ92_04615 [Paludibacteraceae bacterium]|nr:hypothetical protein [Paludibacteraceae bacterium]
MKKMTTFLMALLMVVGAYATSDWQQMVQRKNNHSSNLTMKHVQGKMFSPMAQEDLRDTCYIGRVDFQYAETDGLVYVSLEGQYYYDFYIKVTKAEDFVYGKTYTLADMDDEYTGIFPLDDDATGYAFDAVELTVTKDKKDLHHIRVEGVSGSVNLHLVYDELATFEDVNLTVPKAEMIDYRATLNAMEFEGMSSDNAYYFVLDYFTTNAIAGTFDENTCDKSFCYVLHFNGDGTSEQLQVVKVTAVVTAIEGGYKAEAKFYCSDAKCYNVTFTFIEPTAKTKVTINSTNLDLEDITGSGLPEFTIWANNSEYEVSLYLFYAFEIPGQYTMQNFRTAYCMIADKRQKYKLYSADLTVAEDDGVYTVTGTILCYGDIEFTLNLTQSGMAIDNLEMKANANKRIEKGQVILIRDGKTYNAQGSLIN